MIDVVHYYRDGLRFKRLHSNNVFVFGSNRRGAHGKGAALDAKQYFGAVQGIGEGLQNCSYGIPTKDHDMSFLPIEEIENGVARFLQFARSTPYRNYVITPIGTGLAKNDHAVIAPLFIDLPFNCAVTKAWLDYIPHHTATNVTDLV